MIQLTDFETGNPVFVNEKNIDIVQRISSFEIRERTRIVVGNQILLVREKPEEFMSKPITHCLVDMNGTDWKLLREQKLTLLELPDNEHVNGIIHFIDDIQERAAKVLGEDVVFCEFNGQSR